MGFVKKNRKKYHILVAVNICLITLLVIYSIYIIYQDYYDSIGKRVMSIAINTADHVQLSNANFEYLKQLDVDSLAEDPLNREFERKVRKFMEFADIKYIYLLTHIDSSQEQLSVPTDEVDCYQMSEGTKLDFMYVINTVVRDEMRVMNRQHGGTPNSSIHRYTALSHDLEKIYYGQKPAHQFFNDQWGGSLTGYAPVYSTEGAYIGILGVEISLPDYSKALNRGIALIGILGLTAIITVIFLFLSHNRMHKAEKNANIFKHMSYTDDMTGFLNRRTLNEQAEQYWNTALAQDITIAIMMIDIDCFKNFNDKYGHIMGDQIIGKVTSVIRFCTRENVDFLFRYGGDEFMIMFFNTDVKTVSLVAERIKEHTKNIHVNDIKEKISLSFGIAVRKPTRHDDLFELIGNADKALYISKNKGRDTIHIYEG